MSATPELFSIGHSNQSMEAFLALLRSHSIAVVADVRSQPYSRYSPQFNRDVLEVRLVHCGVRYLFMGAELGGRPDDPSCYDTQGHALYSKMAQASSFLAGVERVLGEAAKTRVALMCSEEDPAVCHRHLLIAPVLRERGIAMQHIRGDASIQAAWDLLDASANERASDPQLSLFDTTEPPPWRSLRSVLQKDGRQSSSAP